MARSMVLVGLISLAGCTMSGPAESRPLVAVTESPTASSTATPTPSPTPTPVAPPIDELLPVELGGVELHTFALGGDILQRLASSLDADVGDLEVRYASDHGARFLQMYAVRLPGTDGTALADAWAGAAYPSVVTDVERSEEAVGGHAVTVVHSPATAPRLGSFYVYPRNETLLVVQVFDPAVAAEALAALP